MSKILSLLLLESNDQKDVRFDNFSSKITSVIELDTELYFIQTQRQNRISLTLRSPESKCYTLDIISEYIFTGWLLLSAPARIRVSESSSSLPVPFLSPGDSGGDGFECLTRPFG